MLVWIYKELGYHAKVESLILPVLLDIMGVLHVDNTDLMVMKSTTGLPCNLWAKYEESTTAWGKLLIMIGGTLKPVKIFHYLVDYTW